MSMLDSPLLDTQTLPEGRRAPGPTGLDIARFFMRLNANTFRAFVELSREYGDVARVPFSPSTALYLLSRPEHVQHVLQDNHRNYRKASTYDYMRPVVGNGLLTSHGDVWMRHRRLVAPMFHRERIRGFADTMVAKTDELLADWERHARRGDTVDVAKEMSRLTLSVAGEVLFSRDVGREYDRIGKALLLLFRDVNHRIVSPFALPRQIPTPHNRKVQKALQKLEDIVYGMIEERRGHEDQYDDLLSMLMLAEFEDTGERMTDRQLRDELMTFMLAGHDTTSNALAFCLYLLSTHPENRRILEDEIDMRLGGEAPSVDRLGDMEYLEMVIDETMRMYPPAWTIEREPIEDDEIGGYTIPAGSIVAASPYMVHHNPDIWENPEGFDPERFAPGARPDDSPTSHRYAHFPFGGGPRKCVGADFAVMEMKIILPMILQRFQLNLTPDSWVEAEGTVTLYPTDGIDMSIHPR